MGYLTDEQVKELLNIQSPDFLLLGQILLDKGIIDNTTLEKSIHDYRNENAISDLDMVLEDKDGLEWSPDRSFFCQYRHRSFCH